MGLQFTCVRAIPRGLFVVLIAGTAVLAAWNRAAGQTSKQDLVDTLLAGLRNHVDHMRSGIVVYDVVNKNGVITEKRFVAFDSATQRIRSDVEILAEERTVKTVITKKKFLHFTTTEDGGLLTRLNPGDTSKMADCPPIDARALGLCEYFAVAKGGKAEDLSRNMARLPVLNATVEDGIGLVALLVQDHGGEQPMEQRLLWVDTANDYVPVRTEFRFVLRDGSYSIKQQVETSWGEINKTWVPIKSVSRFFGPNDVVRLYGEIRLTWKSVNEKVPEELFTEENLKLPKNTYIVDTRLGTPVLEKVIGLDLPVPRVPGPAGTSTGGKVLLVTCIVLVVVLSGILAIRIHRKRKMAMR
jgi:hypothetical protein